METYDIVVVGSGVAGSMIAMVLGQLKLKTLVIERKSHPRFVIGESTIPTVSLLLNSLSRRYEIPELAQVAHYLGLRENGCAGWPKQGFWYGVHSEGRPLDTSREHMFETLLLPMGPDVHMRRADSDAFLVSRLGKYGVEYTDHTEVASFEPQSGGVTMKLRGRDGEREIRARLVVDASGHASFLAKRYGMRADDSQFFTNTRSIFSHVKGLADIDDVVGGMNPAMRFRRTSSTMHHCFPGGWIWVIPFDNETTSVGFVFDRDMYPLDTSITPEQEIAAFIERFPSIRTLFQNAQPTFPWIRSDRIQFTSKALVGDHFILTPHAATFIDPLFSTGLLLTTSFITRFADVIKEALSGPDVNMELFRPIERAFLCETEHIDLLVSAVIRSFRNAKLFRQVWRSWVVGSMAQLGCGMATGGKLPMHPVLYGSGMEDFRADLKRIHTLAYSQGDEESIAKTVEAIVDPWHDRICDPLMARDATWSTASNVTLQAAGDNTIHTFPRWIRKILEANKFIDPNNGIENAGAWMRETTQKMDNLLARYKVSAARGDDFHRAVDRIMAHQNPATFDYPATIKLPR